MKAKTSILFILAISGLLAVPGCKKFLQKDLQGTMTQESFPVSASDALLATNAVYTTTREWFYHSGGYPILDIMSDDARKGSNPQDQLNTVGPYDSFKITTTQDGLDRWWDEMYVGIKRANVVIEKVPLISMDTALQNRYLAEAHFLRGLFYFDMVRAWGGVPLVTTTTPPLKLTRASEEATYGLLLADLQYAESHLPLRSAYTSADVGRATRGAVEALLARVYLFRHDFQNAEKYAMLVINSNQYSLEPNFIDANGVNGNNGPESIFEVGALPIEDMKVAVTSMQTPRVFGEFQTGDGDSTVRLPRLPIPLNPAIPG